MTKLNVHKVASRLNESESEETNPRSKIHLDDHFSECNVPFWTEVKGLCSHVPVLCGARCFCLEHSVKHIKMQFDLPLLNRTQAGIHETFYANKCNKTQAFKSLDR